jgi:hypothetical protein
VIGKALFIIALGAFGIVFGIKSIGGMETDAKHLHGGQFVDITCDAKGKAIAGTGFLSASANEACAKEHANQRDRAPKWLIAGVVVTGFGVTRFRKARSAKAAA